MDCGGNAGRQFVFAFLGFGYVVILELRVSKYATTEARSENSAIRLWTRSKNAWMMGFEDASLITMENGRSVFHDIILGDCRKVLPELAAESVDLVVTSPPYNIGKRYEKRVDLNRYLDSQREV